MTTLNELDKRLAKLEAVVEKLAKAVEQRNQLDEIERRVKEAPIPFSPPPYRDPWIVPRDRQPWERPIITWDSTHVDCGCAPMTVCGSVACPRAPKVTCSISDTSDVLR